MTTFASRASATLVALIAGYSSYTHIAHVALHHGERPDVAYLLPFAIDGLLIVATTAMLDDKRHHRHIRTSARLAFTFGVTASLAANIASAQPTTTARIVAAIPAITLLLAIEVISRTGRPHPPATDNAASQHTPGEPSGASPAASGHRVRPETGQRPPSSSSNSQAMTATVHHRRSRAPAAANRTAAKVAALVAATPDIDTTTVAAQLGVSTRTARRHLATHRGPLAAATRAATTSDDRTAADAPP